MQGREFADQSCSGSPGPKCATVSLGRSFGTFFNDVKGTAIATSMARLHKRYQRLDLSRTQSRHDSQGVHAATITGVSAVSKKSTIMSKAFVFLGSAHEMEKIIR